MQTSQFFDYTGGFQSFTIPVDGLYRLVAIGLLNPILSQDVTYQEWPG